MIYFDDNGYLKPYGKINLLIEEVEALFVWNEHRRHLWESYQQFINKVNYLVPGRCRYWIDGSFFTRKTEPADIDVIIFVPYFYFKNVIDPLRVLKQDFSGKVDCYFAEEFPKDHPKFEIRKADELTWYHFFQTDRRKRYKGFIELN